MIGLITRCKNEYFIEEFCNYYLKQGIDHIYIIDNNSDNKSIYKNLYNNEKISIEYNNEIIFGKNQMDFVNIIYKKIKNNFKWIISVDCDEFITTRKNCKNIIKDELLTTFSKADCIKIPWVMMSCNGIEKSPDSILNTNVYRWNHDIKHPNYSHVKFRCRYNSIEIKCIFKTKSFNEISTHFPIKCTKKKPLIVESIYNIEYLKNKYINLREKHIKDGYLLCYHYRTISKEFTKEKINSSSIYKKKKITFDDIMNCDYSEVLDERLKNIIYDDKMNKDYPDLSDNFGDLSDNVWDLSDNVLDLSDNVWDLSDNVGDLSDNVGDLSDNYFLNLSFNKLSGNFYI